MEFSNLSLVQILETLKVRKFLGKKELEILETQELIDRKRAQVFNINLENVREVIRERSLVFQSVITDYHKLPLKDNNTLENLWKFWLPLGIKLAGKRQNLR
ncbi:MAG: glycerate kinase, partial [Okeania sp. SIO1H6]|nr:glycerate kinase [Okeania sp. SIO1H6]